MEIKCFFVIAIIASLYSDKIDKAVQANIKIKKLMIIICGMLLLVNVYIILSIKFLK